MIRFAFLVALLASPGPALAQDAAGQHGGMRHVPGMSHEGHGMNADAFPAGLIEGGQSAFAAIQEIVAQLMADPTTDWSRVDIEALRQHLIDMDNVTLRARVSVEEIEGGARFEAISEDAGVTSSIRAMVTAHVATMDGVEGWTMRAEDIPGGAALTVTGEDPNRIRALGFIGMMTVGMHHQTHHLALATGQNPHAH
ncbi:hypothetical protein K1T73_06675 [Roseovarius sp. SCSIO 43702]|uniref:hypothetical protein n=1 Tax=Roseovarius sp. SCSIO 43702 TaxID=2823043 RepID=UPI001C72C4B3|nr:hypothetical protein [Roseovarius sp. SCSIO 43702]QYX58050.1 hypothetical protein K1T73_06675 [Roseovarius sp. SCSIO 43702]